MKIRKMRRIWIMLALSVLLIFGVIVGRNAIKTDSASAAEVINDQTIRYRTEGVMYKNNVQMEKLPDEFSVIMTSSSANTSQLTLKDGAITNWNNYLIIAETSSAWVPTSFVLKKGNTTIKSVLYTSSIGSTEFVLYSGTLTSGTYTIEYSFCGVVNSLAFMYDYQYTFVVDRTAPTYALQTNGRRASSGVITNEAIIYLTTDQTSSKVYYRTPGATSFLSVAQNVYAVEALARNEGTWSFYAMDECGNTSATVTATLDITAPTCLIEADGVEVDNGATVNATSLSFTARDNLGLKKVYVKKPNESSYAVMEERSFTEEGEYSFYAVDNANNTSEIYTVTLDRALPVGQLFVDDLPVKNNIYTNGAHIKFECVGDCFVKLPNTSEFVEYASGSEFHKPGKYVFYAQKDIGTTEEYTIIIDRTPKVLTVYNVEEGKTDGDVRISWTNGDSNEFAPIVSVTINGMSYVKGSTVSTIATGNYLVVCEDAAGNVWETTFVSTKTNVLTKTLRKEYYEACGLSFSNCENALSYAITQELSLVEVGTWDGVNWNVGIAMDEKDSVNARKGSYFIYKKEGDANSSVAYFTGTRLNDVAWMYAKELVKTYNYWEKEPVTSAEGELLYPYEEDRSVLADSVRLDDTVHYLLDGMLFIDDTVDIEGFHTLTVQDDWGNTCEYTLKIVRKLPEITYTGMGGNVNTASFGKTYYFNTDVVVSFVDALDEMAMLMVYDEDNKELCRLSQMEYFTVTESGLYKAVAVNHIGKTETFAFIISQNPPTVEIKANAEKQTVVIAIEKSEDDYANIQSVEIYKSTDEGITWMLVEKDNGGKAVSVKDLQYVFPLDGLYKVVVTDEFRTGNSAITETLDTIPQVVEEAIVPQQGEEGGSNWVVIVCIIVGVAGAVGGVIWFLKKKREG